MCRKFCDARLEKKFCANGTTRVVVCRGNSSTPELWPAGEEPSTPRTTDKVTPAESTAVTLINSDSSWTIFPTGITAGLASVTVVPNGFNALDNAVTGVGKSSFQHASWRVPLRMDAESVRSEKPIWDNVRSPAPGR